MIINHKYKFIFFRTRKTASTSMAIALSRFCSAGDTITPLPQTDESIRTDFGGLPPQNYTIPTSLYGRFDWLMTLRGLKRLEYPRHAEAAFAKRYTKPHVWDEYFKFCFERNPFDKAVSRYFWSTSKMEKRPPVGEFLRNLDSRFLSNWGIYTINDHVALDFVGRYENLADDLAVVRDRIGLPDDIVLPGAKTQHRKTKAHYSSLLDEEARRRVEIVCAKEIAAFGYAWEDGPQADRSNQPDTV